MDKDETKTVLITGSSQGIGEATAYYFAQDGYNVVITYHKEKEKALEVEKKCKKLGAHSVLVLSLDISDKKQITKALNEVISKFKSIDVLINNAGVLHFISLSKQSVEDIEEQLRVNLEGTIIMTKLFLPHVKESIINISSSWGKFVDPGASVYCATKWGIRGFTQAIALEHPNLNILSVNPGLTATRMVDFEGVAPSKVAEIIFNAVNKSYQVENGGDIDVWEMSKDN